MRLIAITVDSCSGRGVSDDALHSVQSEFETKLSRKRVEN